jgi:hypothetical protein
MKRSKDMNTRQIAAEYRLAYWAGIVRERTERGLSIRAFCAEKGFHENCYFYWQRKLREAACEKLSEVSNKTSQLDLQPGRFTEVKVTDSSVRLSLREQSGQGEIHIEFPGVFLSADSRYPVSNLVELIKGLNWKC